MATTLITGNTYPVKDAIKALGGRWDADAKGWRVPADKADAARKLVAGAGEKTRSVGYHRLSSRSAPRKSLHCSCPQCQRGSESMCERDWN